MPKQAHAEVGDLIVIQGQHVGERTRSGEILEVLGAPEHEHYRVRWEDGHESIFTPGVDALIRHIERSEYDEPVLIHEP
jgi:hypothetical protein